MPTDPPLPTQLPAPPYPATHPRPATRTYPSSTRLSDGVQAEPCASDMNVGIQSVRWISPVYLNPSRTQHRIASTNQHPMSMVTAKKTSHDVDKPRNTRDGIEQCRSCRTLFLGPAAGSSRLNKVGGRLGGWVKWEKRWTYGRAGNSYSIGLQAPISMRYIWAH